MLRSPFKEEGLNLYGLFGKITVGEYPPIAEVYSAQLRDLVARMLIVDPAKRIDMDVSVQLQQQCVYMSVCAISQALLTTLPHNWGCCYVARVQLC